MRKIPKNKRNGNNLKTRHVILTLFFLLVWHQIYSRKFLYSTKYIPKNQASSHKTDTSSGKSYHGQSLLSEKNEIHSMRRLRKENSAQSQGYPAVQNNSNDKSSKKLQ